MITHSPKFPNWLSCLPDKMEHFRRDPAFRRGWRTLLALENEGAFQIGRLWNIGSVLFKSDSVLRGNTLTGFDLIHKAGYEVRAGYAVEFCPQLVRRFWRYALGRLTDERIGLLARLMSRSPCLYLLVEARVPDPCIPTSLRLTEFKGQVAPHLRREGQLRHDLGRPQVAVLNYVHTADEPADVVRELGLLFGAAQRRRAMLDVVRGCGSVAVEACQQLLRNNVRSDLELSTALARVRNQLVRRGANMHRHYTDTLDAIHGIERGESIDWPSVRMRLSTLGVHVGALDDIIIEGWTVPLKRKERFEPFPSCELHHWKAVGHAWPMDATLLRPLDGAPLKAKAE